MFKDEYNVPEFLTKKQRQIINAPIDKKYIKKFEGNDYVGVPVIIDILNKAFGHAWSWEVLEQWVEKARIYKKPNENKDYGESYYACVKGRLWFPVNKLDNNGETEKAFRDAIGGHMLTGTAKNQQTAFKSASSDALKKAASLLGLAKNVYMDANTYNNLVRDEASYDDWDEESNKYFAKEIRMMQKFKEAVGAEKLQNYKNQFCDETGDYTTYGSIKPSNIRGFIEYLTDNNLLVIKKQDAA